MRFPCKKWVLVVSLASILSLVSARMTFAQVHQAAPMNLTLSPITISLKTNPGESVTTPIKIRNNGTASEQLKISFGTFLADSTGQHPQLLDPKPDQEFMQWLSVDESEITVEPGEWKTVMLTFSPPETAALSYYYTVIFNRAHSEVEAGATTIQGAPALMILTEVTSANARKELQMESFAARFPVVEFLPETFDLKIKNTGNVHAAPIGNIFINGQGTDDLAVISINPGNSVVLPQSSRDFAIRWNDGFPARDESGQVQWDFSKANLFRFGKYTAHILMVYDNGQRDVPIESIVTFFVFPWRIFLVVILIPVLPAIAVFLIMKFLYQRKRKSI